MKSINAIIGKLKGPSTFNNTFEMRKVYFYLANLINSPLHAKKHRELIECAGEILGQKRLVKVVFRTYAGYIDVEDESRSIEIFGRVKLEEKLPDNVIKAILKDEVYPYLLRRIAKLSAKTPTDRKLAALKSVFSLTDEAIAVIEFLYLRDACELVSDHFDTDRKLGQLSKISALIGYGSVMFQCSRLRLEQALENRGLLMSLGFIKEKFGKQYELQAQVSTFISAGGLENLTHGYFTRATKADLPVSAFDVSKQELMILKTVLRTSDATQNVLLYGSPGSGKTSFAHSLAKEMGRTLVVSKIPEDEDNPNARLQAIYATAHLADKDKDMILVDEADGLLNTISLYFQARTSKAWLNTFLESHGRKIVWITNRTDQIEPSTMRRFSFTLEFKRFTAQNRLAVLKYELRRKGLLRVFDDCELKELSDSYGTNADAIVNAINVLKENQSLDRKDAKQMVKAILRNNVKAVSGASVVPERMRGSETYLLEGLNASHNLTEIVNIARQHFAEHLDDFSARRPSVSLLLYGPPGTGKSEFVHYLGRELQKNVLLKRVSDIHDMYVGQTEKNIARAFRDASDENAILFFDEADSFLFPRKDATRSWEKSFTNELLAQLDDFRGVVVFATNFIEGLDHAALRRFTFKIAFQSLTAAQCLTLYSALIAPLVNGISLAPDEKAELGRMKNLTPGDFIVVKKQLAYGTGDNMTHKQILELLMNESRHKEPRTSKIGFL